MSEYKVSDLPKLVLEKYDDIPENVVNIMSSIMMTMLYKQ